MSDWSEAMAVCMFSHTCTPGPRLKEGPDEIPLARGNTSAAVSPLPIGIPPSMAKVSVEKTDPAGQHQWISKCFLQFSTKDEGSDFTDFYR